MLQKLFKIVIFKAKKYFIYIFLALGLSFFSYILGNNIIISVEKYLVDQVKPLVGGDVVIGGDMALDSDALTEYEPYVEIASAISIDSTIFDTAGNPQLFNFIYKTDNYPFYNSFTWKEINKSGDILVSESVVENYGKTLEIFNENLDVRGIVNKGPLSNLSFYANNNKVYLPIELWNKELGEGGRIDYDYFLKWKDGVSDSQKDNIVAELKEAYDNRDFYVQTTDDRNDNISEITDRFYNFIHFFHVIVFVLTFFIVFLSLESFYKRITKDIGLLNILGMTKRYIFFVYALFLFATFVGAFLLALAGNYIAFSYIPSDFSFIQIHSISLLKAFGILSVLFLTGAMMIYLKISKASLQDLLSNETDFSRFTRVDYTIYIGLLYGASVFINLISGISIGLSFLYSLIYVGAIALFYILIQLLLVIFWKTGGNKIKNFFIFDAIRSTIKPGNVSFLFVFSSLISLLSIFVFYVFSASFLSFLTNLSKSSNDMFVLNVQNEDIKKIDSYFDESEIYEIVTLRLEKINSKSLEEHFQTDDLANRVTREFFSTTNNTGDPIAKGSVLAEGGVSIEEMFAGYLGVDIGDSITFSVAGLEKELMVTSLRKTNRTAGRSFFFFELNKNDFENYPKTYFLTYKQAEKQEGLPLLLKEKTNGNLTFVDTKEILTIVTSVAERILLVIYVCLTYIGIFSILGFIVSIQFLTSFKKRKSDLLFILGGDKKQINRALFFEYSYLIAIGAVFAIILGTIFLYVLFMFLDLFTLDLISYLQGIAGVGIIVIVIIFALYLARHIKKSQ